MCYSDIKIGNLALPIETSDFNVKPWIIFDIGWS